MKKLFRTALLIFLVAFVSSFIFNFVNAKGSAVNNRKISSVGNRDDKVATANKSGTNTNFDSILLLVNRQRSLSKTYKPDDLIVPDVRFAPGVTVEEMMMRKEAGKALEELIKKAKVNRINLYGVSGYRSYDNQSQTYNNRVQKQGKAEADKYVALPGQSEHQTGLAMDVSNTIGASSEDIKDFGKTREGKWLADNAHTFGFIIRYPTGKEKITGYNYEPWHIRYVGAIAAKEIRDKGITLEEYLK